MENVTIMTANYDMSDTPCTNVDPAVAVNDLQLGKVPTSKTVYDLMGRRLGQVEKPGLYIVNGKKVFVK
jgi:hypothetical protein